VDERFAKRCYCRLAKVPSSPAFITCRSATRTSGLR
jgi:hypothetical protein